jgi:hypothetical protein
MAKDSGLVELRFPLGGQNRQAGFDQQPPYTTAYCQNVRPFDVVNLAAAQMHGARQRGGARPGIVKAYSQRIGTGPIQLLDSVSVVATSGETSHILLAIAGGTLYQGASGSMLAVTGGPHFNTTAKQLQGCQIGSKYYIADYRAVNLIGLDGAIASTNRLSDHGGTITDWTTQGIDTDNDYVWISGSVDLESNIFPITSVAAGYIVIGGTMTNQASGVTWQIGRPVKVFDPASPTAALTYLGGTFPIPASNYRTGRVSSTNGVVTLSGGTWSGVPDPTAENMLTITIPNASGIGTQQYLISSKDSNAQLTLVDKTDDADCTNVNYAISWAADFYGIPPLNCPLCCNYRGRLTLAGGSIWYMSRLLDPNDFDYGYDPNDPSRAVGGTSTTTGGIPDPLLALIPHSDEYLLFGCERSIWHLTADPAYGGQIFALSREIGVLGPNAWCNAPDGSSLIFSRDGVYQVPPGAASIPQSVSRPTLPVELLDADWAANTISLEYDVRDRGVHIDVTPSAGTAGTHYFLDMVAGGFWPVVTPAGQQPTATIRYAAGSNVAGYVLLGSYDGYIRRYSTAATTDDGTAIDSFMLYGPFRIGGPGYVGEILQLAADLDSNGQGVTWKIYQADTAQAAIAAAVAAGTAPWSGSWAAGGNHRDYPRASGAALVILVSGTYGWAMEGLRFEGRRGGPVR